jgi:hypothetical protein
MLADIWFRGFWGRQNQSRTTSADRSTIEWKTVD